MLREAAWRVSGVCVADRRVSGKALGQEHAWPRLQGDSQELSVARARVSKGKRAREQGGGFGGPVVRGLEGSLRTLDFIVSEMGAPVRAALGTRHTEGHRRPQSLQKPGSLGGEV